MAIDSPDLIDVYHGTPPDYHTEIRSELPILVLEKINKSILTPSLLQEHFTICHLSGHLHSLTRLSDLMCRIPSG